MRRDLNVCLNQRVHQLQGDQTFESFFTPCNTVLPSFVYCCLLSDGLLDGPRIVKIVKIVKIRGETGVGWGWEGTDSFIRVGEGERARV